MSHASGTVVRRGGGQGRHVSASSPPLTKADCVMPYRILRALADKPEISCVIMDNIMLDLVSCLRAQINTLGGLTGVGGKGKRTELRLSGSYSSSDVRSIPLGGIHKKSGKKVPLKAEVVQSVNLLFTSLGQDYVWEWMKGLLVKQSVTRTTSVSTLSVLKSEGEELGVEEGEEREVVWEKEECGSIVQDSQLLSKVSDILISDQTEGMEKKDSLLDRDLSRRLHHNTLSTTGRTSSSKKCDGQTLTEVLSLIRFLLQILPKVSFISLTQAASWPKVKGWGIK